MTGREMIAALDEMTANLSSIAGVTGKAIPGTWRIALEAVDDAQRILAGVQAEEAELRAQIAALRLEREHVSRELSEQRSRAEVETAAIIEKAKADQVKYERVLKALARIDAIEAALAERDAGR